MESVDACHSAELAIVAIVFDMGVNNQGDYIAGCFWEDNFIQFSESKNCSYIAIALELLQLRTVHLARNQFDALFLLFMFFQDLNFILPWLIIAVYKFFLVMLEIEPSFLQDIKIDLQLDAVTLVCSDRNIVILSNQIRSLTNSLQQ